MREKEKRTLTQWDVEFMIRFELGQLPPYLVQRMRDKDRTQRANALEEITRRISRRFENMTITQEYEPHRIVDHGAAGSSRGDR